MGYSNRKARRSTRHPIKRLTYKTEDLAMVEVPDGYVTMAEAAAACNVSRETMRKWLQVTPEHSTQIETSPGFYKTFVDVKQFLKFKR